MRVGNVVHVSGTTASDEQGVIAHVGDAGAQTTYIIAKIERALKSAGASLSDVVRTRVFIVRYDDWEAVARAHGDAFRDIRPANAIIVVSGLIPTNALVEIEAEALTLLRQAQDRL